MTIERLTHLGICVSDLERSLRFYCDVLGCTEVGRLDLQGESVEILNGMKPPVRVRVSYIERDGWRLELMEYPEPGPIGPAEPKPMNRLGLTHLSLRVSDLDATCARIEAAGGGVLTESRLDMPGPSHIVMVHDPDGQRLELIQAPGDPGALPLDAADNL